MSEESFDIPSEHNIKSVIKRTQMRGPRCNSSILCTDKGAIKSEDRESFGLVEKTSHSSRVFMNFKDGLQDFAHLVQNSYKTPKTIKPLSLLTKKISQKLEVSKTSIVDSLRLNTYINQKSASLKSIIEDEDSPSCNQLASVGVEECMEPIVTFNDACIK
jgi:hypothetical protein